MKVGKEVMVLDDAISGVIVKIAGEKVFIVTTDGFEMEYFRSEIILVDSKFSRTDFMPKNINQILSEKEERKKVKSTPKRAKDRLQPPMEVDLHIHQLVSKSKGMSNYDMLSIQIDTAKKQLDFAMKKRIQRVVFIHGIGAGVLRAELEYLFRQYGNLQYSDADFQKYGRGATEVYIFQNENP